MSDGQKFWDLLEGPDKIQPEWEATLAARIALRLLPEALAPLVVSRPIDANGQRKILQHFVAAAQLYGFASEKFGLPIPKRLEAGEATFERRVLERYCDLAGLDGVTPDVDAANSDIRRFKGGMSTALLLELPLHQQAKGDAENPSVWAAVRSALTEDFDNWTFLVQFYDLRLAGGPAHGVLAGSFDDLASETWQLSPEAFNRTLMSMITQNDVEASEMDEDGDEIHRESSSDISTAAELEEWLKDKPIEWAQVIAMRTALRVLPLAATNVALREVDSHIGNKQLLPLFRVALLLWCTHKYPTTVLMRSLSIAARDALDTEMSAQFDGAAEATVKTADAMVTAAYTTIDTRSKRAPIQSAATFAANTVRAARLALYRAGNWNSGQDVMAFVNFDTSFLMRSDQVPEDLPRLLAGRSLWGDIPPAWLHQSHQILDKAVGSLLARSGADWSVWVAWYDTLEVGENAFRLPSNLAEDLSLIIAHQPEKWWLRSAKEINADIADLLAEAQAKIVGSSVNTRDFFISYALEDEEFARWAVDIIEGARFSTIVQFRDFEPGNNFVRQMQTALDTSSRLVALVSPHYEKSDHCQSEWAAFYNADPSGEQKLLVPVMIAPTPMNSFSSQIIHQRLYDKSPARAAKTLLKALGVDADRDLPNSWPGDAGLESVRGDGTGVFELEHRDDNLLYQRQVLPSNDNLAGFSPQDHFNEMRDQADDLAQSLLATSGNHYYSDTLTKRATDWCEAFQSGFSQCNPLILSNKKIVWLLRAFAHDVANGNLAQTDVVRDYAIDLRGYYRRLEVIFPDLRAYREMNARTRFELPSTEESEAIDAVLAFFSDPQSSGDILSGQLIDDFEMVREDRQAALAAAGTDDLPETERVVTESETDAANRNIEVWNWLANGRKKLRAAGKSADDISKSVERFDKAYKTLEPQVEKMMDYLSRWLF